MDLVEKILLRVHPGHPEIACGDVDERDTEAVLACVTAHRHEIVRPVAHEVIVLKDQPRSDDLHHLPAHEPFGGVRRLALLADRDLVSLSDEAGYIGVGAVVGDAAHGNGVFPALIPRCERYAQDFGRLESIIVEHLVKIAHAVKQYGVLVKLLDIQVLLHHGGEVTHEISSSSPLLPGSP